MTRNIVAIHGAFSTNAIFNYIKQELPDWEWTSIDYSLYAHTVDQALAYIHSELAKIKFHYHLVGHSLGGLLALAVSNQMLAQTTSTIATPLAGIEYTFWQHWFNTNSLVKDLYPFGKFITHVHNQTYTKPVQHLISTRGYNPWIWEDNDGVVTLRSQQKWNVGPTHEIASNHAEIMLNPQTAQALKLFWLKNNH